MRNKAAKRPGCDVDVTDRPADPQGAVPASMPQGLLLDDGPHESDITFSMGHFPYTVDRALNAGVHLLNANSKTVVPLLASNPEGKRLFRGRHGTGG
jgi:hypothetical protein